MNKLNPVSYNYNSLSTPGGGFVTGFVFHPTSPNILYARTDIGGVYRFSFEKRQWISLMDSFTEFQHHLNRPLSIAIDYYNSNRLFAICGDSAYRHKNDGCSLLISEDMGNSFLEKPVPFPVDGNFAARSTDERLAFKDDTLYFGSQGSGFFKSVDLGDSWEKLDFPENNITFIWLSQKEDIMIVACTGETNSITNNRGDTLYVSYNKGETFKSLPTPKTLDDARCFYKGFVPVGISVNSNNIVISFSCSHKDSFAKWNSFACDNGGGFDGRIGLYNIIDGKIVNFKDITPNLNHLKDSNPNRLFQSGLGGISIKDKRITVAACGGEDNFILASENMGETFEFILSKDYIENVIITTPYQKPEYNGGGLPIHWMSNLKVNPFNKDMAIFNSGTGVFISFNFSAKPKDIVWETLNTGIEETVHLNIYGIPSGKNLVLDIIGDLGGFAFRQLNKPCENSFADENNNRYITCINADYLPSSPDIFVVTARGNWTGITKGGLIYTTDGGDNFSHLGYPENISDEIDSAVLKLKQPNVNGGWVAMSSDGATILWTLARDRFNLSVDLSVKYDMSTKTYKKVKVFDLNNNEVSSAKTFSSSNSNLDCRNEPNFTNQLNPNYNPKLCIKFFSDWVNPNVFYGFGENGQIYLSQDKGDSFYQIEANNEFPKDYFFSGIDGFKKCEIRFLPDKEGVAYLALHKNGLWKLEFSDKSCHATKITTHGDFVKTVGFGKGLDDKTPALYISGILFNEYGFWRSLDNGKSWARINNDNQMFGGITSIDGDFRKFGRFYLATNARGALYGEES
ncbi:MAG: hypothetical protein GX896_05555 [Clostridiales bacterium]|nr:hypothetical protein [Clostridiales bacterium]